MNARRLFLLSSIIVVGLVNDAIAIALMTGGLILGGLFIFLFVTGTVGLIVLAIKESAQPMKGAKKVRRPSPERSGWQPLSKAGACCPVH